MNVDKKKTGDIYGNVCFLAILSHWYMSSQIWMLNHQVGSNKL